MRGVLYKIVYAGATLSMIIGGCTEPNIQPQKEALTTKPAIQLQEVAVTYYDEMTKLIERVITLVEAIFPRGGVMDTGKTKGGENRYISIRVLEENGVKTLDTSLYIGLDPDVETRVNEYLLNHNYKETADALSKSNFRMTEFCDSKANGLRAIDINDLLRTRDKEGILREVPANELPYLSKKANELYKMVLEITVTALEKELKAREEKMKTN